MKRIKGRYFALLLCGFMLFSDLASIYAHAENTAQVMEEEDSHDHEGHNHEETSDDIVVDNYDDNIGDDAAGEDGDTAPDQDDETILSNDNQNDQISSAPSISIEVAEGGHVSSSGTFFCEPPIVTVTDEENEITSIEISYGGSSKSVEADGSDRHNVSFDVADYVSGTSASVTITATNEAGLTATAKFYIGHTLGSRNTVIVEATCTEPKKSVMYYLCVTCGETFEWLENKLADANGHQFGDPESGSTKDGITYEKRVCKVCGYVEITFDGETCDHVFTDAVEPATCTTEGFKYRECTECGYREIGERIPVTGHKLGSFEMTQEMDCKTGQKRIEERKCKNNNCDYKETRTFAATHTWSQRTVKKAATCTEAGEAGYQCIVCETWDRITSIPMLAHTLVDTDNDCTTPKECSVCNQKDESSATSHALSYQSDEQGHWQECQNPGCQYSTASDSLEEHVYSDDDMKDCTDSETCIVCGYVKSGEKSHKLAWVTDAATHYAVCQNANCEYQSKPEAHAGVDDDNCATPVLCSTCEYPYKAAKSHTPFGIWSWNSEGHYRHCLFCSQKVMVPHVLGEDDGDCTTPIECQHSACGWIMVPGEATHDFSSSWESSEEGHFRRCLNPNCVQTSEPEKHVGGVADCTTPARCSICINFYGSLNPNNHDGGTEIRGYKEPTIMTEGYSGDTYCLGCDQLIAKGEEIPKVYHEHVYNDLWIYDSVSHWKECEKCHARSTKDYAEHAFSDWEAYETGHMRDCDICGYTETAFHIPQEDDNDCTTPLQCAVCGKTLVEAVEHSFEGANYWGSETGHYRFCQNQGCHQTSPEETHEGGTATCAAQAICDICHTAYGDLDADNHAGREQVLGYLEPVGMIPGYTGDIYCLGCSQIKASGQEIPPEEREHDFVVDYDAFYHWVDCSRCGHRQSGTYEEHSFDEDGNCTLENCHAVRTSLGEDHMWDGGKITNDPTCGKVGVKTYICMQCGTRRIEEIAPTGKHIWSDDGVCEVCGEKASYFEFWVSEVGPQTYTGKAVKPAVRVYDGRTLLTEKVDYTISYKNNTKVGDASAGNKAPTVVVTGKGNYSGKKTVYFSIVAKDLCDEDVSISELFAAQTGKVQKPVPTITYQNKKLTNKKDFTVIYPDLEDPDKPGAYKEAGYYRVQIKGTGNFYTSEPIMVTFRITQNALINKVKVAAIPSQTYTGQKIEPILTVTLGGKTLTKGVDYDVAYEDNVQIGKAKAIITGIGEYAGKKEVAFNITGTSLAKASITGVIDKIYSGEEQTQDIEVTLNGVRLEIEKDYEVSYSENGKNVNVGTSTMTVKGIGAYTGTVKKKFKITAYDLSLDESKWMAGFPIDLTVPYTKGGSMPEVSLSFKGTPLTVKKDFTASYSNNKKIAGITDTKKPTITIKGKGNFKGTKTIHFSIEKRNLNAMNNPVTISVPDKSYVNKAGKYISKPVLTDANGKKLVSGTDYEKTVVYTLEDGTVLNSKSIVPAGKTIKVTVTGKGCYEGTIESDYRIAASSFGSAKVTVKNQLYTGGAVTLDKDDFSGVKIGKTVLVYGTDYEIVAGSYKNNVKKGTASVTLKGIGNYAGTKTVNFKITAKSVNWAWSPGS